MDFSEIDRKRLIRFEGTRNFRDLGGYRTEGGRTIKLGLLYRSDGLWKLTDSDLGRFSELNIKVVCDFRSPRERETAPNRLPDVDPPRTVLLPIYNIELDNVDIVNRLSSGTLGDLDLEEYMIEGYRNIRTGIGYYKQIFDLISYPENLPFLFHCTGGKDRTGKAAAMILLALGVTEETIFYDYMLTNVYLGKRIEKILDYFWNTSKYRTHPDVARPFLDVRRKYLEAAFEAMRNEYGSIDAYLSKILTDSDREKLREFLLE